jgi:hypothetical protein
MLRTLVSCSVLIAACGAAQAATITQWNFNSPSPDANTGTGTTSPSLGAGTASVVGVTSSFASGDASGGSTDPATGDDSGFQTTTYAAQGTGDKSRGVQFNVSTLGFEDIVVSWDQRHSNTSSRYVQFQYSTDGTTFTDFGSPFDGNAGDTWFNGRNVNLSSLLSVDNNASFAFRILATFAPGTSGYVASNSSNNYATTGTWRFDMVTVAGTAIAPVPEPASIAMLLAGLLGFGFVALRNRRAV